MYLLTTWPGEDEAPRNISKVTPYHILLRGNKTKLAPIILYRWFFIEDIRRGYEATLEYCAKGVLKSSGGEVLVGQGRKVEGGKLAKKYRNSFHRSKKCLFVLFKLQGEKFPTPRPKPTTYENHNAYASWSNEVMDCGTTAIQNVREMAKIPSTVTITLDHIIKCEKEAKEKEWPACIPQDIREWFQEKPGNRKRKYVASADDEDAAAKHKKVRV